jgi:hypothetical protein
MIYPWNSNILKNWNIVGMNHYFRAGIRHLFVAMTQDRKCIQAEGQDEKEVFDKLEIQASFEPENPCRREMVEPQLRPLKMREDRIRYFESSGVKLVSKGTLYVPVFEAVREFVWNRIIYHNQLVIFGGGIGNAVFTGVIRRHVPGFHLVQPARFGSIQVPRGASTTHQIPGQSKAPV